MLCITLHCITGNVFLQIHEKPIFPIKRKQRVKNCFIPLILSVFTTVASRVEFQIKNVNFELRPLLVESLVIDIFYAIFLMRYAVIINH